LAVVSWRYRQKEFRNVQPMEYQHQTTTEGES
jgi:hypothetical protein